LGPGCLSPGKLGGNFGQISRLRLAPEIILEIPLTGQGMQELFLQLSGRLIPPLNSAPCVQETYKDTPFRAFLAVLPY
jgi:hypothetical protein